MIAKLVLYRNGVFELTTPSGGWIHVPMDRDWFVSIDFTSSSIDQLLHPYQPESRNTSIAFA